MAGSAPVALDSDTPAVGPFGFDVANNNLKLLRTASQDGEAATASLLVAPGLYNGSTLDRARTYAAADGTTGTGVPAVAGQLRQSTGVLYTAEAAQALTDAGSGGRSAAVAPVLYNGTAYDRQRGNTEGTALASAARTASVSSGIITNHNARGVIVALKVTVAGTGTLDLAVVNFDSATGNWTSAVPLGSITTTGTYDVVMYPGAAEANTSESNVVASLPLGRSWFVRVNHSDASSWTYVAAYSLIL